MTIKKIKTILDLHHIPYFTKGNRIYANSMYGGTELFEEVVDVTDFSFKELCSWLGY